jgi:methyl-accepting chemotaxis protein
MSKTDFTNLRLMHVVWRTKLDDFLEGKEGMTEEQATNHKACDVGKWLYSVGMKKYGDLAKIQELEKVHLALHANVKKVMLQKESGHTTAAKEELENLDKILRKIMFLLVDIEENLILNRR